jgi:hypothetical protein
MYQLTVAIEAAILSQTTALLEAPKHEPNQVI